MNLCNSPYFKTHGLSNSLFLIMFVTVLFWVFVNSLLSSISSLLKSFAFVFSFLGRMHLFSTAMLLWVFFLFLSFCHFVGHSGSIWRFPGQGSNQSCSHQPMPEPQQREIWAKSATYTIAQGNAEYSTHWARPGTEPKTSSYPVGFVNHWATTGTLLLCFNF